MFISLANKDKALKIWYLKLSQQTIFYHVLSYWFNKWQTKQFDQSAGLVDHMGLNIMYANYRLGSTGKKCVNICENTTTMFQEPLDQSWTEVATRQVYGLFCCYFGWSAFHADFMYGCNCLVFLLKFWHFTCVVCN